MKTLIQCDFDGTVTEEDVSFCLLDTFAQGDWRRLLRHYKENRISVGEFNTRAFAMVKSDQNALLEEVKVKTKVRAGFHELVNYCQKQDFRLVIVSNGLDFYIRAVLKDLGLENIEVHAAQASFHPAGMVVQYLGPDGRILEDGFKEAYIKLFLGLQYRVIYVGNGDSDFPPAKYAQHVFATGELLTYCRDNKLNCKPFEDFIDIVKYIDLL
jgi:2-hydroxy-3-keto-5-methylthiopentenyl-1-phosphate phosphatase